MKRLLRALRSAPGVQIHERVDLRAWTVVRLGGTADAMIRCTSVEGACEVVGSFHDARQPFLVLGAGTTLVAPDSGLRVPVVSLGGALARWDVDVDGAVATGGAKIAQVAQSVGRAGLSGLESAVERAGSVGGAVIGGFGSGGDDVLARVAWVEHVRRGSVERSSATELAEHFPVPSGERSNHLVLRTRVQLEQDELAAIRERINETVTGSAAAGSPHAPKIPIFRDPPGTTADHVLQKAGCASFARGSARSGGRSPNLLVMARNTKSSDVADLCRTLVETVRARSGVELKSRLLFVDEGGRKEEP